MKHFRKHADIKDKSVKDILIMKGYMELEETKMQYKQGTHLRRLLDPAQFKEETVEETPVVAFEKGAAGSLTSAEFELDAEQMKAKVAALRAKLSATTSGGLNKVTTVGGVTAY